MAFVTSTALASSFTAARPAQCTASTPASIQMAYSPSGMSKYARVAVKDYLKVDKPEEPAPSGPVRVGSQVWQQSLDAMKAQNAPMRAAAFYPFTIGKVYEKPVAALPIAIPPPTAGKEADEYISECITKQYKAFAVDGGVYGVQCAEGTVSGQAEERRVSAGYAKFRLGLRSASEKFGDFFETRKRGVIAAHGCSYEEGLVTKFPKSAATFILGQAEANRTCIRYATADSLAEEYMRNSINMQMRRRSCSSGVYNVSCTEGVTKGQAETARELAGTTEFRMQHASVVSKERAKFESRKYALSQYGHLCSYEEDLFSKFPASVGAAMRPATTGF